MQDKGKYDGGWNRPYILIYRHYHFFADLFFATIETVNAVCACVYRHYGYSARREAATNETVDLRWRYG